MKIVVTIWNFIVKHVDSFRIVVTRIGKWVFKISRLGWKFGVAQEDDWNFVIIPAGFWILRDGFWEDNGIWIDSETWKDS